MKLLLTFLLLICSYMLCEAQATSLTIDNQTPGWLSSKINYGDQQTVKDLKVSGYLNADDIKFIGTLIQTHSLSGLVDIEDCQIVDKEGVISNILDKNAFSFGWQENRLDGYTIRHLKLPLKLKYSKECLADGVLTIDTLTAGGANMPIINKESFSYYNRGIKHLILREGVSEIERYSFCEISSNYNRNYSEAIASEVKMKECSLLESVQFPNTLKIIGERAFDWSLRLREVNLPDSIESIGDYAFGMSSFQPDTLRLPKSLKNYYVTSFYIKDNQVIYVPEISRIGFGKQTGGDKGQYVSKYNILTFYMQAKQKPSIINQCSEQCLSGCTFYVPKGSKESYTKPDINMASGYNYNPFCFAKVVELIPAESILVNPKSVSLRINEQTNISASVLPTNANDNTFSWYSEDESIAKVSNSGLIIAVSPGLVKIYAASNYNPDVKDFCEVTVVQPVTGIQLAKNELELEEDESIKLQASVLPANATNKNVNWTSSDVSVAMVSPDGTVYAIKPGQATIMATTEDGGFVALSKVNVKAKTVLVSNIDLNVRSKTLAIGETIQLSALILPEHASTKIVDWTSTNPFIASVNEFGFVTAISEGKTQIIATTTDDSNLSAICEITVEKQFISISQIRITPSNTTLVVGQTMVLNAIIIPNDASNKAIVWSSTNPSIAIVSATGEVKAVASGEAIIIASTQDGSNLSAMCQITVKTEPIFVESIDLNPSTIEGYVNETYHLEANVLPVTASNKDLKWTSSDENIATVENGEVKLESVGTAIITARAIDGSNIKSECTVIVSDEAGIDSIIADKDSFVKIYNLSGVLVYNGALSDIKLSSGFYIVICNGYSFKIRIE